MEPALASQLVQDLDKDPEWNVKNIVMDDDTTTLARITTDLQKDIKKFSDLKHTVKSFTSALYKISNKELTKNAIKHLSRSVSYAINTNKNDEEGLKRDLKSVVPHSYGDHGNCGAWCGYHKDPQNYKHKLLDKDLESEGLHTQLDALIDILINKAPQIAPCGSTKLNENFNHMVASKAPKSRHYSSSKSLKNRVSAAVAQKNKGHSYLSNVYEKCGISPGKFYPNYAKSLDKKRIVNNQYKISKTYKKRKLQFGKSKTAQQAASEL